MSKKIMILGTNTEVGKTFFSAILCKYLKRKGYNVKYVKPVQTGYPKDDDAKFIKEFAHLKDNEAFSIIRGEKPVASAALFERFPIERVVEHLKRIDDCDFLLIETAGGVCSPIDKKILNYHLCKILKVDFNIVVLPDKLGCINDALLVDYLFRNEGIEYCFAMNRYFSQTDEQKNTELINHFTGERIYIIFDNDLKLIKEGYLTL
ncbi:dethiobiotin synthase [Deferribacter autotrophicus]|uniref:Dethiobiotin synthase n=1 Tax=Deferribacter autotrophicus TaxID=500465 RepID=A0A5A8F6L4_9BACT|nr:dethiobiotin synthase [Deferribacter autotrophicus]KAA0259460.1 dethiobiotin synthase [Deferribacter autotrophicus]